MLNFENVRKGEQTLADLAHDLSPADLHRLTDEMIDTVLEIIAEASAADVVFVPEDPSAHDAAADGAEADQPWTLGHVILHTTASSEESAALASSLARGIPVEGRSRYEPEWRKLRGVAPLRERLEESRRMRHAFLDSWPDRPHLELAYTPYPDYGPLNAPARFLIGLMHEDEHLEQMREILRQAHEGYIPALVEELPRKSRLSGLLPFLRK
jgi:hypothetical protein